MFKALITLLLITSTFSFAFAQGSAPPGALIPWAPMQFFNQLGVVAAGGKLCSYEAGTSTPLVTYTTGDLAIENANPLVLNSAGRPSTNGIYLAAQSYKFVLYSPLAIGATCPLTGTVVWTVDGVFDRSQMFAEEFATKIFDNVRHCTQYDGADAGIKIAACIEDLPSTGGIADARGFEGAQTSTGDPFDGVTTPFVLMLGEATFSTNVPWTLTSNNQTILGTGNNSIIRLTGSAAQVVLIDGTGFANGINPGLQNIRIDGNGLAIDGLRMLGMARASIDNVSVTNVTTNAFHCTSTGTLGCVLNTFRGLRASSSIEAWSTIPDVGIRFDDSTSSANTIVSPEFAGISDGVGTGIYDASQSNTYIGGTSEINRIGIHITANGQRHTFIGTFLEGNTVNDIYNEGFLNTFLNLTAVSASAISTFISGSYDNQVIGGNIYSLTLAAGSLNSRLENVLIQSTLTDSGTSTSLHKVRNNSGAFYDDQWPNAIRSMSVYSSSTPTPTSVAIRAHTTSQGSTNLFEVRDASNSLRIKVDAIADLYTPVLRWWDGTNSIWHTTLSGSDLQFIRTGIGTRMTLDSSGNLVSNAAANLGSSSLPWATSFAIRFQSDGVDFADLGSPSDGNFVYCNDCIIADPCAGGGSGAFAKRIDGTWICN